MRTIHGTLKRLLCALYYRYRTCCVVHAGRRCAPSCVDADKTWSITGALGVMAAALPARAGLRYLLTAVRQALKDRSSWLGRIGIFPGVRSHRVSVKHTCVFRGLNKGLTCMFCQTSRVPCLGPLATLAVRGGITRDTAVSTKWKTKNENGVFSLKITNHEP